MKDQARFNSSPPALPSLTGERPGACEGNGSNADGSETSDGSARFSFLLANSSMAFLIRLLMPIFENCTQAPQSSSSDISKLTVAGA